MLCQCAPSTSGDDPAKSSQVAVEAPADSHVLPKLQRARLESLLEAARRVADTWPWMTNAEFCMLLLEPNVQWVINCDDGPPTFSLQTDRFRQRPVFMRSSSRLSVAGGEVSTPEFLAHTPATAHVDEPFARRTDLPAGHGWLVLGSLEALTAYHPAFEHASTEEWLSVAMHEFLHTQAMSLPSFAATLHLINSGASDPKRLAALYSADAEYRAMVEREYALLVASARIDGRDTKRAARTLRSWLRLYDKRRAKLARREAGADLVRDDSLFTYVEGVARYVESTFLVDGAQHPAHAIAGDARFTGFARWTGLGYAAMPNRQLDAEYYYALGFHLSLLLDRIDPSWKARVPAHPDWLIGVARDVSLRRATAAEPRR